MRFFDVGRRCIAVIAALALVEGCGREAEGPKTVPVNGKVTMEGEPVSGATVTLTPTASGSGAPAQAVTNDAGEFEVYSSFDQGRTTQAGMPPGEYVVTVAKLESLPAQAQLTRAPKNLLPGKYQSPETSDFRTAVALQADNFIALELER